MSMDVLHDEMMVFRQSLIQFDESLKASINNLEAQHDRVSPLWQDEMRRHYDMQWFPLHNNIKNYVNLEAPSYVEFLSFKLHQLEMYLYGNK